MPIDALPIGWSEVRSTLQAYAAVLTAFPRAGAVPGSRWSHVALDPVPGGFTATPTPLGDGTHLSTILDLRGHHILATAGEHSAVIDLASEPTPFAVAETIRGLTDRHGGVDVDEDRVGDRSPQRYDRSIVEAFVEASQAAIEAFSTLNDGLTGEISGPHLWPHTFDIATEWISTRTVTEDGETANAQIATGWYPGEATYVYVNPWPFSPSFTAIPLVHGAVWNTDGWTGARLDIPDGGCLAIDDVVALAKAVHEATSDVIGSD